MMVRAWALSGDRVRARSKAWRALSVRPKQNSNSARRAQAAPKLGALVTAACAASNARLKASGSSLARDWR